MPLHFCCIVFGVHGRSCNVLSISPYVFRLIAFKVNLIFLFAFLHVHLPRSNSSLAAPAFAAPALFEASTLFRRSSSRLTFLQVHWRQRDARSHLLTKERCRDGVSNLLLLRVNITKRILTPKTTVPWFLVG